MMNTEAEPSKSTHCYAIEKKRVKKTLLTQPVEFYLLLPGVFFMIFDHTTHIHSAASSQIFFFQRKKSGHSTDEHGKSVGGKLIVAYCQLLYIWFEL